MYIERWIICKIRKATSHECRRTIRVALPHPNFLFFTHSSAWQALQVIHDLKVMNSRSVWVLQVLLLQYIHYTLRHTFKLCYQAWYSVSTKTWRTFSLKSFLIATLKAELLMLSRRRIKLKYMHTFPATLLLLSACGRHLKRLARRNLIWRSFISCNCEV